MMREIANRIDPETRPKGIAGFDQGKWSDSVGSDRGIQQPNAVQLAVLLAMLYS